MSNPSTPLTPNDAAADSLKSELRDGAERYRKWARNNYIATYALTTFAVLASIASTILVAGGVATNSPKIVAVLAAIPTIVLIATSTFRFEQKSAWHWRKTRALQGLHRQVIYENAKLADVSARLSKVEMELDQEWITFGKVTDTTSDSA